MDARRETYWSIEACAWVESRASVDVPVQRGDEQPTDVVDLTEDEETYAAPV